MFKDKFELVFVFFKFFCFFWLVFVNFGFKEVFIDCFWRLEFFLLKYFGVGLFLSMWILFSKEEFVFCFNSFWVVVGFLVLGFFDIFIGCCMFIIIFWILIWFFFLWRIRFFLVWCRSLLSLLIWLVMFFILIFIELRIYVKYNIKIVLILGVMFF